MAFGDRIANGPVEQNGEPRNRPPGIYERSLTKELDHTNGANAVSSRNSAEGQGILVARKLM